MRTPESQIKAAILHPEAQIREIATDYFAAGYSTDDSIMPAVIQSVEKYGRQGAFVILRIADRLAQTPATVAWLMEELRRSYDLQDIWQDNYRCAVALVICEADPQLLLPVKDEVPALPGFPPQLWQDLSLQVERASWDWPAGWEALQQWGHRTMDANDVGRWDTEQAAAIVRNLGRLHEQQGGSVLALLNRRYRGYDKQLMEWLEPQLVALAGEMKLEPAIPLLIDRLHEDDDAVANEVGPALAKIGTTQAIDALAQDWPQSEESFRYSAIEALECLHCDRSAETALKLLPDEKDLSVACGLGFVALHNFAEEGIEAARNLVLDSGGREYLSDVWDLDDLRWRLIAVSTIMNRPFPEYPEWYKQAVDKTWGIPRHQPYRLADNLGPDTKKTHPLDFPDLPAIDDHYPSNDPQSATPDPAPPPRRLCVRSRRSAATTPVPAAAAENTKSAACKRARIA